MNTTIPNLEGSNPNRDEVVMDESLPLSQLCSNSSHGSFNPTPTLPPSFQQAEEEVRELAKVIQRMHAADKKYWEESEFLLLPNEVALKNLFQDDKKLDHFKFEDYGEEIEDSKVESLCFQERKTNVEERVREQRIPIFDSKVEHMETIEKFKGAINDLREHNQSTPQSLDVQIIEDRIDKARFDLSILEQQTRQIEVEMKTLQMELVKLKDQISQTKLPFDE